MEIIAFASGKGGTGKTLMASCLGWVLIKSGLRVLMIDGDPATDGLSLFLLGREGTRQISKFSEINTFTGILRNYSSTGKLQYDPHPIHRAGSDDLGDQQIAYQAIIRWPMTIWRFPISGFPISCTRS